MPAASDEYNSIMKLGEDIERLTDQENPYTSLTKQVTIRFCVNNLILECQRPSTVSKITISPRCVFSSFHLPLTFSSSFFPSKLIGTCILRGPDHFYSIKRRPRINAVF